MARCHIFIAPGLGMDSVVPSYQAFALGRGGLLSHEGKKRSSVVPYDLRMKVWSHFLE
jgi:hypothetical protein